MLCWITVVLKVSSNKIYSKGWVWMVGQNLRLNLKTLTGEKSEETLMVDNLKVGGVNKMNNDRISLPKVYSKKTLPVEKEEIATPEKVSK